MQQLFFFIQKYKYFLYFLLLQLIAIIFTFNNLSFHKSKFISSANVIAGSLTSKTSNIAQYLHLKKENELLSQENVDLKNKLDQLNNLLKDKNTMVKDTIIYRKNYHYIQGKVIANQYTKPDNFITINKGERHHITSEMAVINSKGIIGIIDHTTKSYARVQSILNRNSKINAKFKNNSYFGTLQWNTKDYNVVQLKDIPRQAKYFIGDTVITGGKSTIFPEGIPIGTVLEKKEATTAFNTINIKLFNDMSNLRNIEIIQNFDKEEIKNLNE